MDEAAARGSSSAMLISPLSAADAAIAGVAALLASYEAWLYANQRRRNEHLFLAIICAMTALYAALMATHYNVDRASALWLSRFEGVALSTLAHAVLAWVLGMVGQLTRRRLAWLGASWLVSSLVTAGAIVDVTPITTPFAGPPFFRRVQTSLIDVLQAYGLALVVVSTLLLRKAPRERQSAARGFFVGLGLWGLLTVYNVAAGILHEAPAFSTLEYGFLGLATSLVANDARAYMRMLAASQAATVDALSRERAIEQLHRDVVASVGEGVLLLDEDLKVRLWNPVMATLTGVPIEAAIGQPIWDVIQLPRGARTELESQLDHPRRGHAVTTQPIALSSSGDERATIWTLAPFGAAPTAGVIAVLRDVTNERRAQLALTRNEQSLRALLDQLPAAVAVLRGDQLVYANVTLKNLLGRDQSFPLTELFESSEVPRLDADTVEVRLSAAPGQPTLELRRLAVEFDGAPAQVLIASDVTQRKVLTARMMEADRLAAVGTLAAGISHEINNPLAFVIMNLEDLRQGATDLAPDARGLVESALMGAHRIRDIVRAVGVFSRAEDERRALLLSDVASSAIAMAAKEVGRRARLVVDHREAPYVVANEAKLAQVLLNLLMNASHAIEEGDPNENEVRVRTYTDGANVVCEVSDTGCGIPSHLQARIFDPFFTTKPVGQGTGLGLSICRETVRALGGDIQLESEVGVGSTFRVILPTAEPVTQPMRLAPPRTIQPRTRRKVLLVDDEPALIRAMTRRLGRHFDVIGCTEVRDALDRLEGGESFDVIITDLIMPETNGMEFFAQVEQRFAGLADRMLFTTGGAFTPEAREFCERMRDRVSPKPIDVQDLTRRIDALCGEVA